VNEDKLFWGLGLVAAALLLVIIEVFIPSAGIISLTAAVCAIAGVYCLFQVSVWWGITGVAALAILGPAVLSFALKIWPSTPMGRKMLGEMSPEQAESERLAAQRERDRFLALIGQEGTVLTDLRPVGMVQVAGKRYDALSETGLIRAGGKIRVISADPQQIKVRAIG
jgi:membrane-bound ClpP family serine protease